MVAPPTRAVATLCLIHRSLLLLRILVVLAGSRRELIATPSLYLDSEVDPFADVPPPLRTSTVDLLPAPTSSWFCDMMRRPARRTAGP